jgi:LemA protein
MANPLDEKTGPVNDEGQQINVIDKQIPAQVGRGSLVFEIVLWCLGLVPGLIFLFMKINAGSYLRGLEQKVQHDASQIDNYLEQRAEVLKNAAKLLDKAIDLDKDTFTKIAALRSGNPRDDAGRNLENAQLDAVQSKIVATMENYPELKAHEEIQKIMDENDYLQREITAAREVYNDSVLQWNRDILTWPTKMIVAAKAGYTTRIPFSASKEVKAQATGTFF